MAHKHYYRKPELEGFKCFAPHDRVCRCGAKIKHVPSKEEGERDFKRYNKSVWNIHRVSHEFDDTFIDQRPYSVLRGRSRWKLKGYALMKAIEKWAKKWPEDVFITRADDGHFMGSFIVLVLHRSPRQYMGVTMYTVPQNGEEPGELFLYPDHRKDLVKALQKISAYEKVNQDKFH